MITEESYKIEDKNIKEVTRQSDGQTFKFNELYIKNERLGIIETINVFDYIYKKAEVGKKYKLVMTIYRGKPTINDIEEVQTK